MGLKSGPEGCVGPRQAEGRKGIANSGQGGGGDRTLGTTPGTGLGPALMEDE